MFDWLLAGLPPCGERPVDDPLDEDPVAADVDADGVDVCPGTARLT